MRRLFDLLKGVKRFRPFVRLNKQCQLDIMWWREFLPSWDGVYFFYLPEWAPLPDLSLTSDASGFTIMARGLMDHGRRHNNLYALHTKNYSPLC